jgi:hypothetical protein
LAWRFEEFCCLHYSQDAKFEAQTPSLDLKTSSFETQKPTQCVCWGSEDHPRAVLSDCAALTNDNRNKRNALAHGGRIRQDIITISEEKNLNVAARWEAAFLVHYNISYAICANIQHRIRIQT